MVEFLFSYTKGKINKIDVIEIMTISNGPANIMQNRINAKQRTLL